MQAGWAVVWPHLAGWYLLLSQIFRLIVRVLLIIPPLRNAGSQCALFSRAGRLADGPQPGQVREYEKLHDSILYAELRVGVRDEREGREGGQVPRLGFYVLGVTGASDSQPE